MIPRLVRRLTCTQCLRALVARIHRFGAGPVMELRNEVIVRCARSSLTTRQIQATEQNESQGPLRLAEL